MKNTIRALSALLLSCATAFAHIALAAEPSPDAAANNFEIAKQLYARQDYVGAARHYKLAAEQGDMRAQSTLGLLYKYGRGVEADQEQAIAWFRKSAEQGWAVGQDSLGSMLGAGLGGPHHEEEATAWFHKAASQGLAEAEYHLAYAYEEGTGVERDYLTAIAWYTKAAAGIAPGDAATVTVPLGSYNLDQYGHAAEAAAYRLGMFYEYGRGVPVDYTKAMAWYATATQRNLATAEFKMGELQERGGAGVVASDHGALYWYQRAADHGLVVGKLKVDALNAKLDTPCAKTEAGKLAQSDLPLKPGLWKVDETENSYAGSEQQIVRHQCRREASICVAELKPAGDSIWPVPALFHSGPEGEHGSGMVINKVVDNAIHSRENMQDDTAAVFVDRDKLSDELYHYKLAMHVDMPWVPQLSETFGHITVEGRATYVGQCKAEAGS